MNRFEAVPKSTQDLLGLPLRGIALAARLPRLARIPLVVPSQHIAERLRSEMPANQAKIGSQYVRIAGQMKRKELALNPEEIDLRPWIAMKKWGHNLIVGALLTADTDPAVPVTIVEQTADIAVNAATDPSRLVPPGLISPFEAHRAASIIDTNHS